MKPERLLEVGEVIRFGDEFFLRQDFVFSLHGGEKPTLLKAGAWYPFAKALCGMRVPIQAAGLVRRPETLRIPSAF